MDITREELDELLKETKKQAVEDALRLLPSVVGNLIIRAEQLKELRDEFYKANQDLSKHKELVAKEIERTEAKHPGKQFADVLELAAQEARKKLGLTSQLSFDSKDKPSLEKIDHLAGML